MYFCFANLLFIQSDALARKFTYLLFTGLLILSFESFSQEVLRNIGNRVRQVGGGRVGGTATVDSLRHRDKLEDSITIYFRYLDSTRNYLLDSSVNDFTRRFPIPATHIYLGNTGNATKSVLFSPVLTAGWDPGFHAFDVYKWKIEKVRFFHTTRPYSEINYMLGSRVEQVIELLHTQNIKPGWNALFQYRLVNSPGFFKNQKANHNNYLFTSWFQSENRRYSNYFVVLGNKLESSENGGIVDTQNYLKDPIYKDRFTIPTKIGGDDPFTSNFFSNKITTGNKYHEFTLLMRQQFDLGRKDSLVTDSTVIPLFYPRLRFEHTFSYDDLEYDYLDQQHLTEAGQTYTPDSAYYQDNYGITLLTDTVSLHEDWKNFINDFSIYQFPDAKNLQQFIKMGLFVQNLTGYLKGGRKSFYNLAGHAEYRNKTRNQLWDIEANGKLYFTGLNAGDYQAYISLQRYVGKKLGYLQLGFANVNRTPWFIFDSLSSFYLMPAGIDFKKENNTRLFASLYLPPLQLRLSGNYYVLSNYTYIKEYYKLQQEAALFNVLQVAAEKTIKLGKRWFWRADLYLQQAVGSAPVHFPSLFTRNRIGYEGNLGFKNLDIAFGTEVRYRAPYKADGYSPVLGQFFYQDSITISNMPDISAYVHFRIRPFKAYIRAENLNAARSTNQGFNFTNNNLIAPGYALPGLQIRVGVWWSFVN